MRYLLLLALIMGMVSCSSDKAGTTTEEPQIEELPMAQKVVNWAIDASGGDRYDNMNLEFMFRERWYRGYREDGVFSYERKFMEEGDTVHDVLNNEGFTRYINSEVAVIPDSMAVKYTNSVNAVLYFIQLPKPLNDDAVIKEYLGEVELKGKSYHKVKVTFRQEGGGEDFTDVFIYWFDKESFAIDYMAYLYHTDGGGIRFREAIKSTVVNGIRFNDYINYGVDDLSMEVVTLDSVYLAGGLEELSRIEQTDIKVELLD